MLATEARRGRLTYAKKMGASVHKVAKLGLKPAATYGQRALGMHPRLRLRLRHLVSVALPGTHFGRSLTLRLAWTRSKLGRRRRGKARASWSGLARGCAKSRGCS